MTTVRPNDPTTGKGDEVRKLYEAGLTVRQIAKALDLSTQGVYWWVNRLGLTRKDEVAS